MLSIYNLLLNARFLTVVISIVISICFVSCSQNQQQENIDVVAIIDYKSMGCFGGEKGSLKIVTTGREMRAILTLDEATYSTSIDKNKLEAYNTFIKELKSWDFGTGCTDIHFYSVKTGNETIERKDEGCSWNGFSILKSALFKQEIQDRIKGYN